ncbi:MAG: ion transporter [Rhodobacterales bacterium]|nr:ion transporter [Rhodobacterales bacterium]
MTKLAKFIESTQVRNFIIGVIIFNAIILGLETSLTMMSNFGGFIQSLDKICLLIFVVELALKLVAYRFRFFTNWWNIFDTLVVAVSLVPSGGSFTVLRAIFYIGSVISTKLFGASFPEWFGTLGQSAYSLFQIMTLESWSMGIVRPVMEVYPYAWVFFVPFIVITTFAVVNLLVGLIVNSMQDAHHEDEHAKALAHRDELMLRLDAIEKKLDRLSK